MDWFPKFSRHPYWVGSIAMPGLLWLEGRWALNQASQCQSPLYSSTALCSTRRLCLEWGWRLVLCLLSFPFPWQWATRLPHVTSWLQGEGFESAVLIHPRIWRRELSHSLALCGEGWMGEGPTEREEVGPGGGRRQSWASLYLEVRGSPF